MLSHSMYTIDIHGDVEVLVQDCIFRVCSDKMSAISPIFRELFLAAEKSTNEPIKFSEDPEVFLRIAQSAHGIFIPEKDIHTDTTLVKLAEAVQKYHIPKEAQLHTLVMFALSLRTMKPGELSTERLLGFIRVAQALHPSALYKLLLDIFLLNDDRDRILPQKRDHGCAWLGFVLERAQQTRHEIASCLLRPQRYPQVEGLYVDFSHKLYQLGWWVLNEMPSLRDIELQLERFQACNEPTAPEDQRGKNLSQECLKKIKGAEYSLKRSLRDTIGPNDANFDDEPAETETYEEMGFRRIKAEERLFDTSDTDEGYIGDTTSSFDGFDQGDLEDSYLEVGNDSDSCRTNITSLTSLTI